MSKYPLTSHTSKMDKIKNKSSVSKGLNYDKDIIRTKESFDQAKNEQEINNIEMQDSIQEPVKNIENYIKYMNNNAKVYDKETKKYLISALNCDNILNVNKEFKEIEELYHSHKKETLSKKKTPNEAYRLYINFNGHNIKASKVHEISTEIAKRICGNEYKCLISTHTNTNNYHSHILINAYNNDGWHKLKEELKIGLKWQRISNIVALENGCDILMSFKENEELNQNIEEIKPKYRSKNEKQTSIKNKLGKDILMHDINETLKNPNITSWQEYVQEMKNKGWQFEKNKAKTILYYRQNFMTNDKSNNMRSYIRETRLGQQYTKNNIEKYLNLKSDKIILKNKIKNINYKLITPPISNDKILNNRIPIIFRLIYLIINLIQILIQNETEVIKYNPNQANKIKENTILLKKQLNEIKKLEKQLKQYNNDHPNYIIENENDLKILKKQTLIKYKQEENQLKNFDKIKTINSMLNSIKNIENNIKIINEYNLFDVLYQNISNININENIAKLDPMSPKTKSRLYNAIHNSNYVLLKSFNQITEKRAKEILYFLSEEKSRGKMFPTEESQNSSRGKMFPTEESQDSSRGKMFPTEESQDSSRGKIFPTEKNQDTSRGKIFPTELCPKIEYFKNKDKYINKDDKRTSNTDNLKQNQDKFIKFKNINNIDNKTYNSIIKIKNDIYKLKTFGIKNINEIKYIKEKLNNQINNLNEINESFKETKETLKTLNNLENLFNGNIYKKYTSLSNLIEEDTFNNLQQHFLKQFNTTTELILATIKLINNSFDLNKIDDQIMPTTEQKLCISLIVKLSGSELTENQINNLTLNEIKKYIEEFLKLYKKVDLENIAKEYFENDIKNDEKENTNEITTQNNKKNTNTNNDNQNTKQFYDIFKI